MGQIIPDTLNGALVLSIFVFAVVFAVTSFIGLVLAAFPLLNRLGPALAKVVHPQRAPSAREQADIVEAQHIAAISAALAAMIGPHRIVHIEPANHGHGWQVEGRAAHHGSHAFAHPGASQRQPDNQGKSNGTEVQNHSRRAAI